MSRRNNRRARSAKPTSHSTESQLAIPKSTKQLKKQKRRERREAKQNRERNRMRESTVDSDGDIDAISESDAESEQQQQQSGCRTVIKQEKLDPDRPGPFDFQRLRTAVTSIIKECVEEFGMGSRMDDYMDWQPEPPRPVYLVLKSEMPCYPDGKVRRH